MSQYPNSYAPTLSKGMLWDSSMIDIAEDMSSQDVIRATVHDFNRTVGKLKKSLQCSLSPASLRPDCVYEAG